jgi:hypothetical protein
VNDALKVPPALDTNVIFHSTGPKLAGLFFFVDCQKSPDKTATRQKLSLSAKKTSTSIKQAQGDIQ